jgi:hypothetical protein
MRIKNYELGRERYGVQMFWLLFPNAIVPPRNLQLPVSHRLVEHITDDVARDIAHRTWVVVNRCNILRRRKVSLALERLLEILLRILRVSEAQLHLNSQAVGTRLANGTYLLNGRWCVVVSHYAAFKLQVTIPGHQAQGSIPLKVIFQIFCEALVQRCRCIWRGVGKRLNGNRFYRRVDVRPVEGIHATSTQ